jgi:hypothetical protein
MKTMSIRFVARENKRAGSIWILLGALG